MLRVLCSLEGDAPKNTAGMLRARVPPSPARPFQPRATKNGWGRTQGVCPPSPGWNRSAQAWVASLSPARGTPPAPLADSQGCIRKAKPG